MSEDSETPSAKYYIGGIEDYPKEFFDNEYLRRGYRINFTTWTQISKSIFMWHNETLNIWSHLIGAIVFVGLAVYIAIYYPNMDSENSVMFEAFQSSANNLSEYVNIKLNDIEEQSK